MERLVRQRLLARVALAGSVLAGLVAFAYFALRGEVATGAVAAVLFAGIGYGEYRRQQRDLQVAEGGRSSDPFERR